MSAGQYWRDPDGCPRADFSGEFAVFGWYLEQDIQSDSDRCGELLRVLAEVKDRRRSGWQGTGNAHTITITRNEVRVETEFVDPPVVATVSLDEFVEIVTRWQVLVSPDKPA